MFERCSACQEKMGVVGVCFEIWSYEWEMKRGEWEVGGEWAGGCLMSLDGRLSPPWFLAHRWWPDIVLLLVSPV